MYIYAGLFSGATGSPALRLGQASLGSERRCESSIKQIVNLAPYFQTLACATNSRSPKNRAPFQIVKISRGELAIGQEGQGP